MDFKKKKKTHKHAQIVLKGILERYENYRAKQKNIYISVE